MSLRLRLLGVSMLTLAIGLGVVLFAANVLYAHSVDRETSNLLNSRIEAQLAALTLSGGSVHVRNTINDDSLDPHGWIFSHRVMLDGPPAAAVALDGLAARLADSRHAATASGVDDTLLRSRPLRLNGHFLGAVVVSVSARPFIELEHTVLAGSAATAVLILLVAGLAIHRALTAALEPVALMTASAEEWGAHDLDRRFQLGPARDEITGLAATLDHLLARIAASRRHEQLFASEMAHELRTPLAAIRGLAELALGHGEMESDTQHSLAEIEAQSRRMGQTIDALMAFARGESDLQGTGTDLIALTAELTGVAVIAPTQIADADAKPALVRQALAPLLDNARRFAHTSVTVELRERPGEVVLTVRDDGPGVDRELASSIFLQAFGALRVTAPAWGFRWLSAWR